MREPKGADVLKRMKNRIAALLVLALLFAMAPVGAAAEIQGGYQKDLSVWIRNAQYREYVEMMLDYHVRTNKMVQQALDGGFAAVFLFDGCSDNLDDPVLSDMSYYRVSGVCVVLKKDAGGAIKLLYCNDNCSTIPDRPLEYGAWQLPEVGKVGPATVFDGTYQLYSVRHKGAYEALHVRTEYQDGSIDAVYMTPEGYVTSRATEINVHTRTSNHTSGRGMWSAGCPLVGGGKATEFWKLMYATYYTTYDSFELDNFVGVLTIDRMMLRTELYTLYEDPDAVDRFLSASRNIQPQTYLQQCSAGDTFREPVTMKAAEDVSIMTLPCSNETDARSRESIAVLEGTKLEVLGTIRNSKGNVWYQVSFEGRTGYVYQAQLRDLSFLEELWQRLFA